MRLTTISPAKISTGRGKEMVYIALLDLVVDVDIVGMEDLWVVEWLENWFLKSLWEVWIFVWGFEAADQRLEALLFSEEPVEETEVGVGDIQGTRGVYRAV